MDDFAAFFIEYQDHAAPKLDVYEQAIYLYVARHTLAIGQREATIGFKSERRRIALGVGKAGRAPSEGVVYDKLKSLQAKGLLKILASERLGTKLRLMLPSEVPGIVPPADAATRIELNEIDFFSLPEYRRCIIDREKWQCFYCLVKLDENNHVIEHVISQPAGDNSYRNLVAACRRCNNRKGASDVEDFLRLLYRDGMLSGDEFEDRLQQLSLLRSGDLRPKVD